MSSKSTFSSRTHQHSCSVTKPKQKHPTSCERSSTVNAIALRKSLCFDDGHCVGNALRSIFWTGVYASSISNRSNARCLVRVSFLNRWFVRFSSQHHCLHVNGHWYCFVLLCSERYSRYFTSAILHQFCFSHPLYPPQLELQCTPHVELGTEQHKLSSGISIRGVSSSSGKNALAAYKYGFGVHCSIIFKHASTAKLVFRKYSRRLRTRNWKAL